MSNFFYCTNCNNLFNPELIENRLCPVEGCRANELVELDELIAYQVRELNLLGYETDCCCSGHIRDIKNNFCGSYILFNRYYEIIDDIVKKYLSDNIEFKHFENGIKGELRWELRFKESYIEDTIGIPPDYRLIVEYVDLLNKLINHLKILEEK